MDNYDSPADPKKRWQHSGFAAGIATAAIMAGAIGAGIWYGTAGHRVQESPAPIEQSASVTSVEKIVPPAPVSSQDEQAETASAPIPVTDEEISETVSRITAKAAVLGDVRWGISGDTFIASDYSGGDAAACAARATTMSFMLAKELKGKTHLGTEIERVVWASADDGDIVRAVVAYGETGGVADDARAADILSAAFAWDIDPAGVDQLGASPKRGADILGLTGARVEPGKTSSDEVIDGPKKQESSADQEAGEEEASSVEEIVYDVSYEGVEAGESYRIVGELHLVDGGRDLGALEGQRNTADIVADADSGSVEMTFTVDRSEIDGELELVSWVEVL